MGYNIAGSGMRSAVCRALMRRYGDDVVVRDHVPATMVLETSDAFIEMDTPEQGAVLGRPYLVLVGRAVELRGDFPFDVTTVRFAEEEDRPPVSFRYELSRTNLVEMCAKGLFEPGFDVPDVIRNTDFELPCSVSCAALAPVAEDDSPVVFADVDVNSLSCGDAESGYDIDEYFEAAPGLSRSVEDVASFEPEMMTRERADSLLDAVDDVQRSEPESRSEERTHRRERKPVQSTPSRPSAPSRGQGRAAAQRAAEAARANGDGVDDFALDMGEGYI